MLPLPDHCRPLLITGVTGVAGFNAFNALRAVHGDDVIGIGPRRTRRMDAPGVVALDAEDAVGLRELFRTFRFKAALNAVGNCALKACELDPAMARRINVDSAEAIARAVRETGARLVHLSSDLVFSGSHAHEHDPAWTGYVETDATDPVTVYGKTMVQAEAVMADLAPEASVLRIALPMGKSFNGHAGAIDWIQSRFRAGRPATLYFDEVRSSAYCDDITRVCVRMLARTDAGLLHMGGPRAMSLYGIAQTVNRVGGYDPHLLRGCPRVDAGPMPPRAGNVTMCSDRLVRLLDGSPLNPWPLGDNLLPTHRQWHFDREADAHEPGGPARLARRLYRY